MCSWSSHWHVTHHFLRRKHERKPYEWEVGLLTLRIWLHGIDLQWKLTASGSRGTSSWPDDRGRATAATSNFCLACWDTAGQYTCPIPGIVSPTTCMWWIILLCILQLDDFDAMCCIQFDFHETFAGFAICKCTHVIRIICFHSNQRQPIFLFLEKPWRGTWKEVFGS